MNALIQLGFLKAVIGKIKFGFGPFGARVWEDAEALDKYFYLRRGTAKSMVF